MNYKNLNYEIETCTADVILRRPTMNYKNLNYEIETEILYDKSYQIDYEL